MRYLDKLTSIRVWWSGALPGILAGAVASLLAGWLFMPVFVLVTLAIVGAVVVSDETVVRCPFCRKRVSIGASVCGHCGRDVTAG